jgi:hypothetical protein
MKSVNDIWLNPVESKISDGKIQISKGKRRRERKKKIEENVGHRETENRERKRNRIYFNNDYDLNN